MINRKLCKHEHVKTILTPELVHYGKKVCEDCGKFLGWVSDPDPNKLSHKKKCEMVIPVLEKYAERNGQKTKSTHKMRKTYASKLNANGVPLDCIREQLGHSRLSTTLGYIYNPLTEQQTYDLITSAL